MLFLGRGNRNEFERTLEWNRKEGGTMEKGIFFSPYLSAEDVVIIYNQSQRYAILKLIFVFLHFSSLNEIYTTFLKNDFIRTLLELSFWF